MRWNYTIKKCVNLVSPRNTGKLGYFIFIILLQMSSHTVFSQLTDYTIIGRVLDENGQPISKADIRLASLNYEMSYYVPTNEDGRFSINKSLRKGDTRYFYVSEDSKYSEDGRTLIDPPFFEVNVKNKHFLGKPIKFGDKKIVDVGDVTVQFWFNTVYFKFQINGRNLNEKEWESLWCRLKDEKGRILAQSTVGPIDEDTEIDLKKSILKLSLPEGKWKLEFQKFDWDKVKSYPKIIGQTPYFVVDKNKNIEVFDVVISN